MNRFNILKNPGQEPCFSPIEKGVKGVAGVGPCIHGYTGVRGYTGVVGVTGVQGVPGVRSTNEIFDISGLTGIAGWF